MEIIEPTLLLDEVCCRANIRRMAEKARKKEVILKPHFKTHQSAQIGEWFREEGIEGITVSSVKMANYFADQHWQDITIAFPVNVLQVNVINDLASRVDLTVFINSAESARILGEKMKSKVRVMVEVNTGNHRTGIPSAQKGDITQVLDEITSQPTLELHGLYVHPGHTYRAQTLGEVREIYEATLHQLSELRSIFSDRFGRLSIAVGDTPSASLAESWSGVDQMHPGNFVFYDLMQQQIGSCTFEQIAVCMACPVVEKRPERQELIIHGGAIHFSKDRLSTSDGSESFGQVVHLEDKGWSTPILGCYVKSLSQEHGLLRVSPEYLNESKVGDIVGILPVHSCLTANLMKEYRTLSDRKITMMPF